jgi:hypothetical protein
VDGAPRPAHEGGEPSWAVRDRVALLRADPQFSRGIPDADAALARRVLVLPRLTLRAGPWSPPARDGWPAPIAGLLLLDGIAARHVVLGDRIATQLLGPGDILEPWATAHELVPCLISWSMDVGGSAAVLDGRFSTAARRWPSLATVLQERLGAQGQRLATHLAICQLPRVEQRVVALLWALAERFGRMTPDGVVVPLRLTHRMIGQLIGAQRPTVSLALSTLVAEGHVARRPDATLVLAEQSRSVIAPDPSVAARPGPARVELAEPSDGTEALATEDHADGAEGVDEMADRLSALRERLRQEQARTEAALKRSAAARRRHVALREGVAAQQRERADADGRADA